MLQRQSWVDIIWPQNLKYSLSAKPCCRLEQMFYGSLNVMFYFLKTQVSNSSSVFLERQRCALWIRKLCEPSGTGAGVTGRRNRNLYAKLLLHMLRRGALEGPFTHRPEPGTLKTLPSYMVGVFDQKMHSFVSLKVSIYHPIWEWSYY